MQGKRFLELGEIHDRGIFLRDERGDLLVYCPNREAGKGFLLPDEGTRKRIIRAHRRSWIVSIGAYLGFYPALAALESLLGFGWGLLLAIPVGLVVFLAPALWWWWRLRRLTAGLERIDESTVRALYATRHRHRRIFGSPPARGTVELEEETRIAS